jgi:hypothetical protein
VDKHTEYIHPFELIQVIVGFFTKNWIRSFAIAFVGGLAGFFYAYLQPITYTARNVFVVQEGKSGGSSLSSIASLAGQFGVNIGGGGAGGVLAGDNIFLYFKNERLVRQVMLSPYSELSTPSTSFGDAYARTYGFAKKWNNSVGYTNFREMLENQATKRTGDSLLQILVRDVNNKRLDISRLDKKADFISINCTMLNENLAKIYCDRVLNIGINEYSKVRTARQENTVKLLQSRYDSISTVLKRKTNRSVSLQLEMQASDVNILYKGNSSAATEEVNRDKAMLSAVLIELTKNLELAKYTLSEETPAIQVIESSILPLQKNITSKLVFTVACSLLFLFLGLSFYLIYKAIF